MKRPAFRSYAFGNPLSMVGLVAATLYFAYAWWTHGASPWLPLVAAIATSYAVGENEKLQKYGRWQREWALMEGRRPGRFAPFAGRLLKIGLAVLAWCFFAFLALQQANDLTGKVAAALFWAATLLILAGAARSLMRKRAPRQASRPAKCTTVCVPAIKHSGGLAAAYAALPAYCHDLMRH